VKCHVSFGQQARLTTSPNVPPARSQARPTVP